MEISVKEMLNMNDTIAGIATGMASGGIGIIRVSGENAFAAVDSIFRAKSISNLQDCESHRAYYGHIVDGDIIIDEVMCLTMRAPKTYTREDVVEIQCHGGVYVIQKILDMVLNKGVRLAEPGEFTKRAFLNGRIDLSQAEAVMDMISAKNHFALQHSMSQLRGDISDYIENIRAEILHDVSFIEAALDDPEHYEVDGFGETLAVRVKKQLQILRRLYDTSEDGRKITEGIRTVIVGKPNAGKSSLLNQMLGDDRAIVTDIAGTTRDCLEETVQFGDILLRLVDTAGIRSTEDVVEKIGVEKTKKYLAQGDLILYVVDSSNELTEEDEEILKLLDDKEVIILLNKTDLPQKVFENNFPETFQILPICAANGQGIQQLEEVIRSMFFDGKISFENEVYITNLRHKEAIGVAITSLKKVMDSIDADMPEDFYSIDLMDAYTTLGTILGETVEDDLVDTIFREFCMGK